MSFPEAGFHVSANSELSKWEKSSSNDRDCRKNGKSDQRRIRGRESAELKWQVIFFVSEKNHGRLFLAVISMFLRRLLVEVDRQTVLKI